MKLLISTIKLLIQPYYLWSNSVKLTGKSFYLWSNSINLTSKSHWLKQKNNHNLAFLQFLTNQTFVFFTCFIKHNRKIIKSRLKGVIDKCYVWESLERWIETTSSDLQMQSIRMICNLERETIFVFFNSFIDSLPTACYHNRKNTLVELLR